MTSQNFGVSKDGRGTRFNLTTLVPLLEDVHERLSGVQIECLSFEALIPRYDDVGHLFYLDPPYYGNENDYGKGAFKRDDFKVLAELLGTLKGRFILSLNDVPDVREIFARFKMEPVELNYTLSNKRPTKAKELIISR